MTNILQLSLNAAKEDLEPKKSLFSKPINFDIFSLNEDPDPEPQPDLACCSECGWEGPREDCLIDQEGDWETGYYDVDLCPRCEDGGCIDDYNMTEERKEEWYEWKSRHEPPN